MPSRFSNPCHIGCLLFTLTQNANSGNELAMRHFHNLYAMLPSVKCNLHPHTVCDATLICNASFRCMQAVSANAPLTSPLSSGVPLCVLTTTMRSCVSSVIISFVLQTNVSEERGKCSFKRLVSPPYFVESRCCID